MVFNDVIYEKILGIKKGRFTLEDVSKITGLKYGFDKKTLQNTLKTFVKEGKLKKHSGGYFSVAENLKPNRISSQEPLICEIIGSGRGYAFARIVGSTADEDIFIPENSLNGACHKDKVLVKLQNSGGRLGRKAFSSKREGRVEKILERGMEFVVGILSISDSGAILVFPDDTRFTDCIFIPPTDSLGAKNNTKVVVEIVDFPARYKMATGKVKEILGDPKDTKVTTLSIIRSFNLFEEFPQEVIEEAERMALVSDENLLGRKDYRDNLIITIDGKDAKDFDDAITLSKNDQGYFLGVFIADVSHYVKQDSKLDKEAFKRGTSVYFPDHVLPMLPEKLSNGLCSLNPHEDRLVLAVEINLDLNGKVKSYQIHKGIINSSYRMTYSEVTQILNKEKLALEKYQSVVPMIFDMKGLAQILIKRRKNAGEIDFDIPEPLIILDSSGEVTNITKKPREMSDRIIEQFMVLTNEVIAKHFSHLKIPFVYRVHEQPSQKKIADFKKFAGSLGLDFASSDQEYSPKDFQNLLEKSKGEDYYTALSKVMLRSMQKARYDTENLGHFGLALKDYCHFTSPIRRYPDLTIHRIISECIEGELSEKRKAQLSQFVKEAADMSSKTERVADEAERTVDKQKETEFMAKKIGEVFSAKVSGVTENNIYVELDNTIEGQINISRLRQGKYNLIEDEYTLIGPNQKYRIGDTLSVRLVGCDIALRKIEFELADFHSSNSNTENGKGHFQPKEKSKATKHTKSLKKFRHKNKNN